MDKQIIFVNGPETEMREFREELIAYAESKIADMQGIQISPLQSMKTKITDKVPLGHVPVVEVAISISSGVVTGVIADLRKEWIKEQIHKHKLTIKEKRINNKKNILKQSD